MSDIRTVTFALEGQTNGTGRARRLPRPPRHELPEGPGMRHGKPPGEHPPKLQELLEGFAFVDETSGRSC
jgi:hypothetical protein